MLVDVNLRERAPSTGRSRARRGGRGLAGARPAGKKAKFSGQVFAVGICGSVSVSLWEEQMGGMMLRLF